MFKTRFVTDASTVYEGDHRREVLGGSEREALLEHGERDLRMIPESTAE